MAKNSHEKEPWVALPAKHEWHSDGGKKSVFDEGCWFLLPEKDVERLPICIIDKSNDHHKPTRLQAEHTAKRIVACVNACAGIPTSVLENIGKGMGPDWLLAKQQRDAARQELKQIRELLIADPEESTFDEVNKLQSISSLLLQALQNYVHAVAVGGTDKQSVMAAIRKADGDARAVIEKVLKK